MSRCTTLHLDGVIKWEHFPRYWPFVRGIHRSPVIFHAQKPVTLAICAGNSPVPGEFPAQRHVTRSFDVFFDLRLNKRLSKQSWGWWFEAPSRSLWRHCNANMSHEFDWKHHYFLLSIWVCVVYKYFLVLEPSINILVVTKYYIACEKKLLTCDR